MLLVRSRFYSDSEKDEEKKRKKVHLKHIESNKGRGRAALGLHAGLIGGYTGKKVAENQDKKNKSDEEILRAARLASLGVGAGVGGATGALLGSNRVIKAAVGAGIGGVTAYAGGSANTKHRLYKRALLERELNGED